MRNRQRLGVSLALAALLLIAAAPTRVEAQILGPTTLTFEEGVTGTIVSDGGGSDILIYEEGGITLTAIQTNPGDHFHLFADDVQIFGSDSSGATFTATDGGQFNLLSLDITEADTQGQLVANTGDVFNITAVGTFSPNFFGVTSVDWIFTGSTAGDPSIELDNVLVTPVPEPVGALLTVGMLSAACLYRRPRT